MRSKPLILGAWCALWFFVSAGNAVADAPAWIPHPSGGFSISATEVSVAQFRTCVETGACDEAHVDSACNYGKTDREDHPINCVTYQGAEQFCAAQGGDVCTEDQWLAACRGDDARAFPYGSDFDLAKCNSASMTVTVKGRERTTAPVGSHADCVGGLDGLFDMAGNVGEWINACKGTYCKFRGGGYMSNDPIEYFAACSGVCSGNQKSLKSGVVGIRCCRAATGGAEMSVAPASTE